MTTIERRESLLACRRCERLAAFLEGARLEHPDWHCAPVPAWGDPRAKVLIVGLAPGFRGANRTGRPFCGDQSGLWLYRALHELGWAESADPLSAGGRLRGLAITNAVKCVPPENKPTRREIRACAAAWLEPELERSEATVLVALGNVAHASLLDLAEEAPPDARFGHGHHHLLRIGGRARLLLDAYHPSPLNTRTGRLTWEAFLAVLRAARDAGERSP
jgi:uracil-DNA glycosylase family 4